MKCNISSYRNWFTIQQWNNKNDTDQIFIVSNRLNNTKDLLINEKIYKILAVMNLNQIINWEKSKGVFHWVSVTLKTHANENMNIVIEVAKTKSLTMTNKLKQNMKLVKA